MLKKNLLTASEVRELASISRYTIAQAIKSGKLNPVTFGPRTRRFKAEEVERLLAGKLAQQ